MKRYLSTDLTWWAGMLPAFLLAGYFVLGWLARRNDPSTLLSAVGTIAAGVIMTCMICARSEGVPVLEICEPACNALNTEPFSPAKEELAEQAEPAPAPASFSCMESNPWYVKGVALAQAKQYRDALYCFTYVLQSDPCNQPALTAKGECLMKMNRPEEALRAFMAAAQIDENNPLAKECKDAVLRRVRPTTWS